MDEKRLIPTAAAETAEERIIEQGATIADGVIGGFGSDSLYNRTLQGTPIHGLIASSTSPQNMQINAITRAGTIQSDGVIITVDEEAILTVSAQTFKVLIMLLTIATEQLPRENQITPESILRGRSVRITLEDYMRACGTKDKKTAREQLNTAIRALFSIALEWDETEYNKPEGGTRKKKERVHHATRIIDEIATREGGNPIKRGAAEVQLTYSMAEYLAGAYIMPYPSALLTINTNNHPYSIPLGWKLCALYNINYGKQNQGKTTVGTLLKAAKGIPRYDVIASKGQVYDRIIKPFDRDMRELVDRGILSEYYYFDDMGIRRDDIASLTYLEFSALNVWYEIKGYPDQTPRLEAKQKRISAAISRTKRAAKKKQEAEAQAAENEQKETGAFT